MKVSFCIAGDGFTDSTILRVGIPFEVNHIPRIGEKIRLDQKLFDFLFGNVYSSYKDKVMFNNGRTTGTVVEIMHDFYHERYQYTNYEELKCKDQIISVVVDFKQTL